MKREDNGKYTAYVSWECKLATRFETECAFETILCAYETSKMNTEQAEKQRTRAVF